MGYFSERQTARSTLSSKVIKPMYVVAKEPWQRVLGPNLSTANSRPLIQEQSSLIPAGGSFPPNPTYGVLGMEPPRTGRSASQPNQLREFVECDLQRSQITLVFFLIGF